MSHHVLILGGHGKIAQLLTSLLLQRSWTVTSIIRAQEQVPTIEKLGAGQPGKLNVLVSSIEDVTSQAKAASILDQVKPDYIAWSAGAGGKGDPERTFKIDRDAAVHFIRAAAANPSIARFLLISYIGSRRAGASWWPEGEWEQYHESINNGVLAKYYQAKIVADEELYRASRGSTHLVGINLRPGLLTEDPADKVTLGKTPYPKGNSSRASVAKVADSLLAVEGIKNTWLDLYDGDEEIDDAVKRVVQTSVNVAEGEPVYLE